MANDHHDIDQAFRARFDGLKDHSVDPATQWAAVEQGLSASAAVSGASVGASGVSSWAMAASFAGIVALGSVVTTDHHPLMEGERSVGVHATSSELDQGPEVLSWKQATTLADRSIDVQETGVSTSSTASDAEAPLLASVEGNSHKEPSALQFFERSGSSISLNGATKREGLDPMDVLSIDADPAGIVDRELLAAEPVPVAGHVRDGFYVRGGLRFGKGESNSSHVTAGWRANNVLTGGFAFHFTPKTFVSLEVGHMRRSGNGIERSKDVDFGPLIGVIASAYDDAAIQGALSELKHIRESLVATTMDYVHMPIQVHVDLHDGANASIGMYTDYLVRVRNESYMVYNSRDYINASFGLNDDHTMEGLNRFRFGLMAGYQQHLSDHIVADVRGLIPVTSQYDRSSEYSVHEEPSQLVDFQFSLIYKI